MLKRFLKLRGAASGENRDRAGTLLVIPVCATLLAACGASLQDEYAADLGQSGAASNAAESNAAGQDDQRSVAPPKSIADTPERVNSSPAAAADTKDRQLAASDRPEANRPAARARGEPAIQTASLSARSGAATPDAPPASAQLPSAAKSFAAMAEPGTSAYLVGPLDVLTISVFRVPELSTTVQVADTGTFNMPLLGEVSASGRTAKEIERDLTAQLGEKYLQNPQVTVAVKEYNSRRVTVDGSVKKPGVYPLRDRTTLLQSITMAEGLDNTRASGDILVFRQIDGKRSAARFNLDEIREGNTPDPAIEPGDVIIVLDSTAKIVFHNILRALPISNLFLGVI